MESTRHPHQAARKNILLRAGAILTALLVVAHGFGADQAPPKAGGEPKIQLVVRADDLGSSHTANVACIQAYRQGIVRTTEVMVPGPWFTEAVQMLADCPDLDVGVHLTLTSEWDNCKWGPVTRAPSLADALGHFRPMVHQRKDFPADTGFVEAKPAIADVERELRAQIEIARKAIPRISHLSNHMGTATATPELRALTLRLAKEYKLPLELDMARTAGGLGGPDATGERKEAALVKIVENLKPGLWLLVDHPGLDTPEMQALGHLGYRQVAADRAGVTQAFCSPRVSKVIADRGIRLTSYREAYQAAGAPSAGEGKTAGDRAGQR